MYIELLIFAIRKTVCLLFDICVLTVYVKVLPIGLAAWARAATSNLNDRRDEQEEGVCILSITLSYTSLSLSSLCCQRRMLRGVGKYFAYHTRG